MVKTQMKSICSLYNVAQTRREDTHIIKGKPTIKGTGHNFFLVRNTHESFSEAMENTYISKDTAKSPQNCCNCEEK